MSTVDYGTLAALTAIAFGGAFIFGVTGFGSALLTIPLATHLVPLPFALAMFSVLDCTSAWRIGLTDPKSAQGPEWKRILPGIIVGSVVGMTLLVNLPRTFSMLALGVFVLAIAVSNIVRASAVAQWTLRPPRRKSCATRPVASKRSCHAPATWRTS